MTSGYERIRFQAPQLPDPDQFIPIWDRSRRAQWFSNGGPCVSELAIRLAEYVSDDVYVVPVSNATSALLATLKAVAPTATGTHVLVPSYTFAATAAAIHWVGMTPIFVDVDPYSWHADPEAVSRAIKEHRSVLGAALLCSTYGAPPPSGMVEKWEWACEEAGIPLVVDSAAGFGSCRADGVPLGRTGDAEVFSFHATKPFAIGEGGAVVTRSRQIAQRVEQLANFGFSKARVVDEFIGLNFKLDELHAAVALSVLGTIDEIVRARQRHTAVLRQALEPRGFVFQADAETSAHQFLPMLCESSSRRDALIAAAEHRGVELRAYFSDPLHTMAAFRQTRVYQLPVTEDLAARVVCLPVHNEMTEEMLARIADACVAS